MAKAAKKKNLGRVIKPASRPVSTDGAFEIEKNPPIPRFKAKSEKLQLLIDRVDKTLAVLRPGEAFIMPSKSIASIRKYLRRHYVGERFWCKPILDNKEMMRVYWLKTAKK